MAWRSDYVLSPLTHICNSVLSDSSPLKHLPDASSIRARNAFIPRSVHRHPLFCVLLLFLYSWRVAPIPKNISTTVRGVEPTVAHHSHKILRRTKKLCKSRRGGTRPISEALPGSLIAVGLDLSITRAVDSRTSFPRVWTIFLQLECFRAFETSHNASARSAVEEESASLRL
ncbi:hypothetical protein BJ546DRAFT_184352 [Cryomyces antarcticus]